MGTGTVLITGAGSGMGRLAAQRWADAGRIVAAIDVNEPGLTETVGTRSTITPFVCDVTDADAVERTVQQVEASIGPITRLVNAAAIARVGRVLDHDPGEIRQLIDVNFVGLATVCHAVVPSMLERGRGEVINFASLAGWIPQPKMGAYCATKFAVVAYTEALWMENRDQGVSFHCVCPPAVDTPMLPDFFAEEGKRRRSMAIAPSDVIDEIERAVARERFLVLPTSLAKILWRTRRHTPRLLRRALTAERFDLVSEGPRPVTRGQI